MEGFEWLYATVGAGVGAALTGASVWAWQKHFASPAVHKDGIDMASGPSRTEGLSICEKGKLQYLQRAQENQPPNLFETEKGGKFSAILSVITSSGKSDAGLKIKAIRDCGTPRDSMGRTWTISRLLSLNWDSDGDTAPLTTRALASTRFGWGVPEERSADEKDVAKRHKGRNCELQWGPSELEISSTEVAMSLSSPASLDRSAAKQEAFLRNRSQVGELVHGKSGKAHRGPALIGTLFRQHADGGVETQPFSPRIHIQQIKDPESDEIDLNLEPETTHGEPHFGSSITGTDAARNLRDTSDNPQPALRRRLHQPSTLSIKSDSLSCGTTLPTPSWRDNDVYHDPEVPDNISCAPEAGTMHTPMDYELPISTRSSLTAFADMSGTSNCLKAAMVMGEAIHPQTPVCITFEEVLPHPSRGLLSRMLRLADVPMLELPGVMGPVLQFRTGQDYLVTCLVLQTAQERLQPKHISLMVPGLRPEVLVLEGGGDNSACAWTCTGRWHAPEEGMLAVDQQKFRPVEITARLQLQGEQGAQQGQHPNRETEPEQQFLGVFLR